MPDQRVLALTPPVPCRRCGGAGDVYYLANRPEVIGGKRVICPECRGSGYVGADRPQDRPQNWG